MPSIVRKTTTTVMESRREVLHSLTWHVQSSVWSPPTDLLEAPDACIVRVEIAGMREEDFEVALENNILMIRGTRRDPTRRAAYHQMEIHFGKFATAVQLPAPVMVEKAEVEYRDGLLTITLPRTHPDTYEVK